MRRGVRTVVAARKVVRLPARSGTPAADRP